MEGWVLRERRLAACRVWARVGDREFDAVRIYRPDVIPVEGGSPGGGELAGFTVSFPLADAESVVELWAEDGDGVRECLEKKRGHPLAWCDPTEDPEQRFATFRFVNDLPFQPCAGSLPKDGESLSFEWIVPDFGRGAGGHAAIFRTIRALEGKGHRCRIWILHNSRHGGPEQVREVIAESFVPVAAEVRFLRLEDIGFVEGDVGFATDRWTAYYLRNVRSVAHRFYLVQDFEPAFYPLGSAYYLAEETYRFGFSPIASSDWLARKMRDYTEEEVPVFGYGIDHSVYRAEEGGETSSQGPFRVVFYARAATSRRVVEVGMLALELLAERRSDFIVDFFGEDLSDYRPRFPAENHGVLSASDLARLYRGGTVGMVFSATNHAILPKEMMACGLPVIELDGQNLAGVYPESIIHPVHPEPRAVADAVDRLLDSPEERLRLRRAGLAYASAISWEAEMEKVLAGIGRRLQEVRSGGKGDR